MPLVKETGDTPPKSVQKRTRKTSSTTSQKEHTANVNAAVQTLNTLYGVIGIGLMSMGLQDSAAKFANDVDVRDMESSNRKALEASPKLAAMIAKTGTASGSVSLIISNGMLMFGLYGSVQAELAAKQPKVKAA